MNSDSKFCSWYAALSGACIVFSTYMIFSFLSAAMVADDSYIVARYAANFVTTGELVYNAGERVNAVTSPLLLTIYIVLTYCFSNADPVALFSRLAISCFVITCILAAVHWCHRRPETLLLFLTFFATSPFYSFWMVGGLETPVLSLILFYVYLRFIYADEHKGTAKSIVLGMIIGLGILARYDSILLFLPILIFLLLSCPNQKRLGRALVILVSSASLPGLWFVFCQSYYGDVLPTSFAKATFAPGYGNFVHSLVFGSIYVFEFGIYTGFLFAACCILLWRATKAAGISQPQQPSHFQTPRLWVAWLGVFLFLGYCCLFGTVHMMYGYRMLVPLIPVLALLISVSFERISSQIEWAEGRLVAPIVVFCFFILSLNAVNFAIALKSSINPSRIGEFRGRWDIKSYFKELKQAGEAIKANWEADGVRTDPPVVASPNEGYFAYMFPNWIVVGGSLTDKATRSHIDYYVVEENIHDQWLRTTPYQVIYRGKEYYRVNTTVNISRVLVFWNPTESSSSQRRAFQRLEERIDEKFTGLHN